MEKAIEIGVDLKNILPGVKLTGLGDRWDVGGEGE